MVFEPLGSGPCRAYLIASERTREAALVDPVLAEVEPLLKTLRERGLTLRWVIDTHTHADHLSGATALRKKTDAEYVMHRDSAVRSASKRVEDGESLGLGELALKFSHVPGHTRDSLMLLLPDRLLSGDFLFIGQGGAGRLDLPGGDAAAHYESLRKLDALPDGTALFPGHDYRGQASSTLAAERAANPVLRPRSREEYLRWWSGLKLGPADWMHSVLKANAAGTTDPNAAVVSAGGHSCEAGAGACSTAAAVVPEWTPAELAKRLAAGSLAVIDVRQPEEYRAELGHVAGSRLIPLGELAQRLGEVPKGPVVTVCRSGKRSSRGAAELIRAGWTDVHSLAGGMLAWNEARLPVER
ncbi:MAG: MBL fold metallo-hydrolase [Elusimicrobia bacterium]|nr:MBL fold metallo-hydrolase [Elusimicrobiota bacterium]